MLFVPEGKYQTDLSQVVARGVAFEEISIGTYLSPNVEVRILVRNVVSQSCPEILRVDFCKLLGRFFKKSLETGI